MGKGIGQAFKILLSKSGYSDKATNEVWKWYRTPPKKSKKLKKWHSLALLVDPKKTRITILHTELPMRHVPPWIFKKKHSENRVRASCK